MANIALISTYEMGRQPFGIASPAAALRAAGADVSVQDLAVAHFDPDPIRAADLVAFHIPMHTATRLAEKALDTVRAVNPGARICFYGLYGPPNDEYLRAIGADDVLGPEFEPELVAIALELDGTDEAVLTDPKLRPGAPSNRFTIPDRTGLPALAKYGRLELADGSQKVTGYTEATRGCRHLCRHCPVVPVYGGRFVVVPADVVIEDVRRQVDAGAEHITFGDPDFFNGPRHGLRIVERLHREFPNLTYDVTVKVEHLHRHSGLIPTLKETGCALVTSAVESFDDDILGKFDKRHTTAQFDDVLARMRAEGLPLNATFVAFTPWTSLDGYAEFLHRIAALDLVGSVAPIQYAIRLLIVARSRLLELDDVASLAGDFDPHALAHPWVHPDPRVDRLQTDVLEVVESGQAADASRVEIFTRLWDIAQGAVGSSARVPSLDVRDPATIPFLTEPWFC